MDSVRLVDSLFEELMSECKVICSREGDEAKIRETFTFARDAHEGVKRKSGEPYITHPIAVARIVVNEIGLGVTSVQAALLHDVVEDTDYTLEDISFRFGEKVARIVDGLTKLSGVFDNNSSEQAENFKRMLLTLSDDMRVILIKIADRLHNMRTLGSMLPHKQMKIASETIYLFAPLAHRLGLYAIKSELEDLSLKFRFPTDYAEIEDKLDETRVERNLFIEEFNAPILRKLKAAGLEFTVTGRVKSVYSIWKKIKQKQVKFEEIYDLFAIRIVFKPRGDLSEKAQCWYIYSLLSDIYIPKMDRIRDWVRTPKANGYEALHCTLMSKGGVWAEVQIRTQRMDDIAERGLAAHSYYKEGNSLDSEIDPMLEKLREALQRPTQDAVEFLDNFKMGLQVSEIMVFTPKGEGKTMPKGSTALDFAYEIHSKVGSRAIGAKINYKLLPIYTEIKAGDQIEIITSDSVRPTRAWLEHVITPKAKYHIKQSLKGEVDNAAKLGQETFEAHMQKLGITSLSRVLRKLLAAYKLGGKLDLYTQIGSGLITTDDIDKQLKENAAQKIMKFWSLQFWTNKNNTNNGGGKELEMSECCNPMAGDEVIGFDIDGKVMVHKKLCPNAIRISAQQGDKIVEVKWTAEKALSFLAILSIRGIDRMGLLLDVSKVISEQLDVNIREVKFFAHDGIFEGTIALYVRNYDDFKNVVDRVGKVKGIEKVSRVENEALN